MPRGSNDGSIRRVPAARDAAGRVITREHWIVRKRYTDLKGRPREKKRIVYAAIAAQRAMRNLAKLIGEELAGKFAAATPSRTRTVADVITHCKAHQFKPAVYVGDVKIAGHRSWTKTWSALKPVEKFFGSMVLTEVTHDDFQTYREERLSAPVVVSRVRFEMVDGKKKRVEYEDVRQRSLACVNRELAWARRVFSVALQKKWIVEHPFTHGDPLIAASLERKRVRILTNLEERQLFAACTGEKREKRAHLAFAITMALETWMRKSEQFRLNRETDINLEGRVLTALSYKGNRALRRLIPITEVLLPQLVAHLAEHPGPDVFDYDDPTKAFASACRDAGIEGVTWHTLRHTGITRAVHVYKLQPIDVMKISGHTVWKTFFETYVNINEEMARCIGARIDAARAEVELAALANAGELEASDAVN